jgi:membrane fusion protein (multidrug efflux system)
VARQACLRAATSGRSCSLACAVFFERHNADIPVTQHPLYVQAKAQVDEAQRQLEHTVVRAPFAGVVTQVDALQPDTYLVSQTAALTNTGAVGLVSTEDVWVVANVKEIGPRLRQTRRPGKGVDRSYPGQVWSGTVQSISPASRAQFSILPAQKASGNWGKVVQRIPVRIRIDRKSGNLPLWAGMSATVDFTTAIATRCPICRDVLRGHLIAADAAVPNRPGQTVTTVEAGLKL